ncbi:MAG: HIT family protein [Nanoarchaeota archaeon]
MTLTKEQVASIKTQLRSQVQTLPEDKKSLALKQIEEMSDEAIESLVKQERERSSDERKSIFRMIIDSEIESVKITENASALAVLDINPISKGHTIIIPKKEVIDAKSIPTQAFSLAKIVSKRVEDKLKAKSSEIQTEKKFGESIIHVIPIYDAPLNLDSPRQKSSMEELNKIAEQIKIIKKPKLPLIKQKKSNPKDSSSLIMKRRIP